MGTGLQAASTENTFFVFICIIAVIIVLHVIFTEIANHYIKSHKETLFNETSPLSIENKAFGHTLMNETSTYNSYIKKLGLNRTYSCSSTIVSNASKQPIKYLIKYSNVDNSKSCLEQLDFCVDYVLSLKKLRGNMKELQKSIYTHLPVFVKIFANASKAPYIICDVDYSLSSIKNPVFTFSYISAAGKSKRSYKVQITPDILKDMQSEISAKIEKTGHSKTQRSAMTNDLREAIKKRDNYTCCICGNSVFKEPNLLLEVDHIVPVSKGGKTEASNLQTLCWRCNRKKSNK